MMVFISLSMLLLEIQTMDMSNISHNNITSNGLDDITRLLESTQLKDINVERNNGVFNDDAATRRFA